MSNCKHYTSTVQSDSNLYECDDCGVITAKKVGCPGTGKIVRPGTCVVPLPRPGAFGQTVRPCPNCNGLGYDVVDVH